MKKGIPDQNPSGPTDVPPHNAGTRALADNCTDSPTKATSVNEDTPASHPGVPSAREGPAVSGHQVAETKWPTQPPHDKSQPQDKEDTAASHDDLTGHGRSSVDESYTDPREPFLDRAAIDRRVSMGEVIHTLSPNQLLASVPVLSTDGGRDLLATLGDATEAAGKGSYSAEPRPDPREPLSRRSTIDRCISQGIVIPTSPSVKSLHSYTGSSSSTPAPLIHNLKGDVESAPNAALETEDPSVAADLREPMDHRVSIDRRVSMGKVIPTKPPPGSPVRSISSAADASPGQAPKPCAGHHRLSDRSMVRLLVTAGLVAFALILVAVSVLVVRRQHSPFHLPASDVCDSDDCMQHARSILAAINRSADPCVDFHAHVCGRREAEPARGNALAHAYSREVVKAIEDAQIFLSSNHTSSAAAKAFAAFSRCSTDRNAITDVKDFLEFMRDRGIPWPRPVSTYANGSSRSEVLDVLLDLAVNWRVALWFDVTVSMRHDTPVIIFGDIGDIPSLRMWQLSGADDATYRDVARNMSLFLSDNKLIPNDAELKELHQDETAFRKAVHSADAYDIEEKLDDFVPVSDVAVVFGPAVSSAWWATLLGKYLNTAINVSTATKALILNGQQLARIGRIVGSLPDQRLLNVIGWMFAYAYVWTVNADFDVLSPMTGGMTAQVQCFLAVQESFGILQMAPMFQEMFDASERSKLVGALSWTSAALVELVNSSSRIAESTKTEAIGKIASLASKRVLPPETLWRVGALDKLYINFPEDAKSFFQAWLQSRKALKTSLASPYYGSLMTSRYQWRSGSVQYVYALNELQVSLSALFPSSYLRGGSAAMTYAGLGFQLARQLVRSVDLRGRELDRTGRKTTWWFMNKSDRPTCRLDQAKSARERRQLGDLFALEMALTAMQKSSTQDPSKVPLRLKSLEALTATQTFYVSYCSHHCDGTSGRLMCNLAMNATEFHRSFKCARVRPNVTPTCVVL